jgi:hypothetical protein
LPGHGKAHLWNFFRQQLVDDKKTQGTLSRPLSFS